MQCACVVLYCRLRPVRLYHIFPHYLIQGTIFGKKNLLVMKSVLLLTGQLLSETLLILRRKERNIVINVHRPSFWSALMKLEFSKTDLKKKHKGIKFNDNPSSGSRFVPCG